MKRLIALITMLALPAFAAEVKVDVGVFAKTVNFEDTDEGMEVGVRAFLLENLGAGVRARATDLNGTGVEQLYVDGLYRITGTEKAELGVFAGVHQDFELDETGIQAGLRGDMVLYKKLRGYGYIGWEKLLDRDADHGASAGAGLSVAF